MNPQFWSFQSDLVNFEERFLLIRAILHIKLKFSGLSCLIYCNNFANFCQILRWFISRLGSLDMEWPSFKVIVWKEALTICQDHFCVLSLSLVLEAPYICIVIQAHQGGPLLHRYKAPPLLPYSQYICCKYIIEDRENPQS